MIQTIHSRAWTAGKIIRSLLVSDANMRAAFGDRVYPLVAPEGTDLPLCVYRLSATDRTEGRHMTGASGLVSRSYEVAFYGSDYDEIDALASAFRERLESWRGDEGGLKVRRVDIDDERDEPYERPEGGADEPVFARAFEVSLKQIETTTALPADSYGG